jgi:hypothetical protein
MASTAPPPPPPRTSSTIALAACSGRLPRITLILSERPSASCSITRNFALASLSSATSRSNTSAATDDLLRQELQRSSSGGTLPSAGAMPASTVRRRLCSVMRGHQRLDAGLLERLRDQAHLLPAPARMHDVGLHQRGDVSRKSTSRRRRSSRAPPRGCPGARRSTSASTPSASSPFISTERTIFTDEALPGAGRDTWRRSRWRSSRRRRPRAIARDQHLALMPLLKKPPITAMSM